MVSEKQRAKDIVEPICCDLNFITPNWNEQSTYGLNRLSHSNWWFSCRSVCDKKTIFIFVQLPQAFSNSKKKSRQNKMQNGVLRLRNFLNWMRKKARRNCGKTHPACGKRATGKIINIIPSPDFVFVRIHAPFCCIVCSSLFRNTKKTTTEN